MSYNIYCLKENDKIVYIGNTSRDLKVRFSEHIRRKELNEDIFTIESIEVVNDKETAKERENYYIKKYNLVEEGMNVTYGYGTKGLGSNDTSFKKGNNFGKLGTKKVRCVETGIVYNSVTSCAKSMSLSISKISAVCRGKRKTTGGYRFEFV